MKMISRPTREDEGHGAATGDGTRSVPATFEFFDPREEVCVTEGNLPHWTQPGVTYFVTFRTEDSVPRDLERTWYARRADWLRRHGINPSLPSWKSELHRRGDLAGEFHAMFTRQFMEYLDRGYGQCVLRQRPLAQIVNDSLRSFNATRYHLGDFIVMPNHVHLLVCLIGSTDIEKQCRSWRTFTARQINAALDRRGRFWQEESFDHLVRDGDHFERFQRYIADNPRKAGLCDGDYLHCPRK